MRGQMVKDRQTQIIFHAIAISALLFVALFLATRYGLIHCSQVPYWCDGYVWLVQKIYGRTYPQVLVVYGDSGMGDPKLLARLLDEKCNIYTDIERLSYISPGNLEGYDVLIVERARQLSAEQMAMIWDFASKGGKVLIVGDTGAELAPGDSYVEVEEYNQDTNTVVRKVLNVWDRKDEFGNIVLFGTRFLGLKYIGNYCRDENCTVHGTVLFKRDYLTKNLPPSAPFTLNFAVVENTYSSVFGLAKTLAVIDGVGKVGDFAPPFPAMIRIGYRILYIAFPPEQLWLLYHRDDAPREGLAASRIVYNICSWAST